MLLAPLFLHLRSCSSCWTFISLAASIPLAISAHLPVSASWWCNLHFVDISPSTEKSTITAVPRSIVDPAFAAIMHFEPNHSLSIPNLKCYRCIKFRRNFTSIVDLAELSFFFIFCHILYFEKMVKQQIIKKLKLI